MKTLVLRTARLEAVTELITRLNREQVVPDLVTAAGSEAAVRRAGTVGAIYPYAGPRLNEAALGGSVRRQLRAAGYGRVIICYNNARGRGYGAIERLARGLHPARIEVFTPGRALIPWSEWWPWLRQVPEPALSRLDEIGLVALGALLAAAAGRARPRPRPDPIRVLHVQLSTQMGGGQQQLASFLKLETSGRYRHEVALYGIGPMQALFPAEIPVHLLEAPSEPLGGLHLVRIWRLWKLLRDHRCDLVHGWMFFGGYYGAFAAALAGVPALTYELNTHHWKVMPYYRNWWYRPVDRAGARVVNEYAGDSQAVVDDLKPWLGLGAISLIHSGIEAAEYDSLPAASVRERFGLPAGKRVVAVTARLLPEKDHRTFIAAAGILRGEFPDTCFAIFGSGPGRASLAPAAERAGVRLIGEDPDFRAILASLDLFALSSVSEGFPISLLAAGAAGKPCVVTDAGGTREIIEDGVSGWVVPQSDPPALAAAVRAALRDPAEAARRGARLRGRIRSRFTMRQTVDGILGAYARILWSR